MATDFQSIDSNPTQFSTMTTKPLAIDLIRTDGGTQMRAELDQDVYFDYRDKWLAGVDFDPVDVFHDGSMYWLADGFHRFNGARLAKRSSIPARVHEGTLRDAMLFATGANTAHGLRRSNSDKRKAVTTLLNDEEWVKWSDGKIAEQTGVSPRFVTDVRAQLGTVPSSPAAKTADLPRVGRDGRKRKPRRKSKSGPKKQNSPAPLRADQPGREPGEAPVEPQQAPKRPNDKAGNVLPDRPELLKAFSSRDLFSSCETARKVISDNSHEIAKLLPNGEEFKAAVDRQMKALVHVLATYEPAYVCQDCNGGGCQKCGMRGFQCSR